MIPLERVKTKNIQRSKQLWRFPDEFELVVVTEESILPVFPTSELDKSCSRNFCDGQMVTFRVLNDDILDMFCSKKN